MQESSAMRILVVDDSSLIHSFIHQSLGTRGVDVVDAENGRVAFDLISAGEQFDLILLDWNMPEMDGPTFLQKASDMSLLKCPVVMMTTENSPQKIIKAMGLGASEYIMKPFDDTILLSKLEAVLQRTISA